MKHTLLGIWLLLVTPLPAVAGPYESGLEAYERGEYSAAVSYWRLGAYFGDAESQLSLATAYNSGKGVSKDTSKALELFLRAAEGGSMSAQFQVGSFYESGLLGAPRNQFEAAKWYGKAAEQGHSASAYRLGEMYFDGRGVPKDEAKAIKLMRLSDFYDQKYQAERGHAAAQVKFGLSYQFGRGVTQDFVLAHMWFNIAAAQGNADAANYRDSIAETMTGEQITEAQRMAREWKPKQQD